MNVENRYSFISVFIVDLGATYYVSLVKQLR